MSYKAIGTIKGNTVSIPRTATKMKDASSISRGLTFLTGELEKVDEKIRQPLSIVTYARDIAIKTGGGWVETLSAMGVDYGLQGGGMEESIMANTANQIPVIQADMSKEIFKTHIFSVVMRIGYFDMERAKITSRSLEQLAQDGIRASYDKHMDRNTYLGFTSHGTHGLLNNPNVLVTNAPEGAKSATEWSKKTAQEILDDVNNAIADCWARAEHALEALPNHILMPFEQFNDISTRRINDINDQTILGFLLENNITKRNGGELVIAATNYCKKAGAGNKDRMMVYVNDDKFVAMEELVPLQRIMTEPKTDTLSYDTVYSANLSEVMFFYDQPLVYVDGI